MTVYVADSSVLIAFRQLQFAVVPSSLPACPPAGRRGAVKARVSVHNRV